MDAREAHAARLAALCGAVIGLLGSAMLSTPADAPSPLIALGLFAALFAVRPTHRSPVHTWTCLLALSATLAGLAIGAARLTALDSSLLSLEGPIQATGTVTSTPKPFGDARRFDLEIQEGGTTVQTPFLEETISEGSIVEIEGSQRDGVLYADRVEPTGAVRGGVKGLLDDVRRNAESALERGTQEPAAALLRGFVLGQDDRIPEPVRDEFRRSGLAHVLAVSGQNVMLLALLTLPILALFGVPIRSRLLAVVLVIAIYVPVAGAGASIQRAGVMGVAGLVAALAGRPRARWYALGLAALVTLAVDPRASSDIGWQLSFAAVAGLLVLTQPLIQAAVGETGAEGEPGAKPWRRAVAEGLAMTVAATLATGPLVAHHFGVVSLTTFAANLLALPAIAPAMWLGMLAGAIGQIPGAPVELLTWMGGLFAGYIGWVARALGGTWAQTSVPEPSLVAAIVWTLVLVGGTRIACVWVQRRRSLRAAPVPPRRAALVACALGAALALALAMSGGPRPATAPELAITVLDVGQGDAILIQPRAGPALLVDTGPPEAEVAERLGDLGVDRLEAVAVTHDQLDHSGGLAAILDRFSVTRLLAPARIAACEHASCPNTALATMGDELRMGRTRVEVLWPPPRLPPSEDPNATSLVLRVEHRGFSALLTGDAERELAPFRSGPVDLLKVAHHGSADSGLGTLLEQTSPTLALISVGSENSYGHPSPQTLETLTGASVPFLTTEASGDLRIEVGQDGWSVE